MSHQHHHATVNRRTSPPAVHVPRDYNAAVDFVDRHLDEGRGDKVAFCDDRGELTYAGLAEQVARAGNVLRALGVLPEQRVLLILQDTVHFPVVFFGAVKIGAVPVPVSTMLTTADYDYLLRDSRAGVLIVSAALHDKVAGALCGQPFLRHVVIDDRLGPGHGAAGEAGLSALLSAAPSSLLPAPTTGDDVCFWLYTSGSTGQPKAAVHLHSHLVYTAEYYGVAVLGIQDTDVVFSAAKLFFAYGLGNAMTFPLRVGATALLMAERATPRAVLKRLYGDGPQGKPTIFGGVPTLYASLLDERGDGEKGLRREGLGLRRCLSAGEALPEEVGRRFRARTGVDILDGIGSTEMLHIFLSNRPGDVRYGSSGQVVPGYQAKLLDENGQEVRSTGPPCTGDLWVSGPSSAVAYWNKRELSQRTFEGRWIEFTKELPKTATGKVQRFKLRSG